MAKKSLETLLSDVEALFKETTQHKTSVISFSLCKFPEGWRFDVVNYWGNWVEKGYETHFGFYNDPKQAVQTFLNYVKDNDINVSKLMD